MKFQRLGVFAALVAATAFVGCSSDKTGGPSEQSSSVSFDLTTSQGVVITTVNYDLNTSGGADVASGSIPVPNPDSTISLGIESLPAPASYSLAFAATGMYQGQQVPCVSAPQPFSLAAGQDLTLPTINLVCTIEVQNPDTTGSVNADVNVVVEQINVGGNIVETFSYGPRSVNGVGIGGVCTFPPIQLNVFNNNTAISYGWTASPDGNLALNATGTSGTYTCVSGGQKTLTLTATMGTTVQSKSVTVSCNDANCDIQCGDGVVAGTEQCDEATPRCTACVITPVCGDGVVDGPDGNCAGPIDTAACVEQCDHAGTPGPLCDMNCVIPPAPSCDDDIQNGEETGVDCGGPVCPPCDVLPTCTDGIQNQGETGVDCGGPCPACVPGGPACFACWQADAEIGPFQAAYCDPQPTCLAVEVCVMNNTECLVPIPGECYCGPAVEQCRDPSFVPVGPCVPELRAGTGNPATNGEVLDRMTSLDFPAGVAMLTIDTASRNCPAPTCPFQP